MKFIDKKTKQQLQEELLQEVSIFDQFLLQRDSDILLSNLEVTQDQLLNG